MTMTHGSLSTAGTFVTGGSAVVGVPSLHSMGTLVAQELPHYIGTAPPLPPLPDVATGAALVTLFLGAAVKSRILGGFDARNWRGP